MEDKIIKLIIIGLGLLGCAYTSVDHVHEGHGARILDPYPEILSFLHISERNDFTTEKLEILVEELFERLECDDHEHDHDHDETGHDTDHNGDHGTCNKTIVRYILTFPCQTMS